jgi:calcineurin-like phosphoesterase family protein
VVHYARATSIGRYIRKKNCLSILEEESNMSRDIWVSSDLHYNHSAIINFIDYNGKRTRNFDDVEDMNERLIERHNAVVKPGDLWYNLGDVFMGPKDRFVKDWPKFNGYKRLIVGNHDDVKYLSGGGFFQKVSMWRQFTEYGIMMSHVPLHESSLWRGRDTTAPSLNVHGHIHRMESPTFMHYNVSVEALDNYQPIHIEDLAVIAKQRRQRWIEDNK